MEKIVSSIRGKDIDRKNARKINDSFYEIGVDCIKINGTWNRIDNGRLYYNLDTEEWGLIKEMPRSSRAKFVHDILSDTEIYGYTFNRDKAKEFTKDAVSTFEGNYVINEERAVELGYVKLFNMEDIFVSPKSARSLSKSKFGNEVRGVVSCYDVSSYRDLPYTIDIDNNSLHNKIASKSLEPTEISKSAKILASMLKGKTIGIEVETVNTYVPRSKLQEFKMYPVRDGSLDNGYEFISPILSTAEDFSRFEGFMNYIKAYGKVDRSCSLHVHVGGVKYTNKELVSLYCLLLKIQDELERFMPYERSTLAYKAKKSPREFKDYNKKLPSLGLFDIDNLSSKFSRIYSFLNEGYKATKENNPKNPQYSREGTSKWNIKNRYYCVNMIHYFFGHGTVEFRMHEPTMDAYKTFSWILIINSILEYAKNNTDKCISDNTKIFLRDVICNYDVEIVNRQLKSYVQSRKVKYDSNLLPEHLEKKDWRHKYTKNKDKESYIPKFLFPKKIEKLKSKRHVWGSAELPSTASGFFEAGDMPIAIPTLRSVTVDVSTRRISLQLTSTTGGRTYSNVVDLNNVQSMRVFFQSTRRHLRVKLEMIKAFITNFREEIEGTTAAAIVFRQEAEKLGLRNLSDLDTDMTYLELTDESTTGIRRSYETLAREMSTERQQVIESLNTSIADVFMPMSEEESTESEE